MQVWSLRTFQYWVAIAVVADFRGGAACWGIPGARPRRHYREGGVIANEVASEDFLKQIVYAYGLEALKGFWFPSTDWDKARALVPIGQTQCSVPLTVRESPGFVFFPPAVLLLGPRILGPPYVVRNLLGE